MSAGSRTDGSQSPDDVTFIRRTGTYDLHNEWGTYKFTVYEFARRDGTRFDNWLITAPTADGRASVGDGMPLRLNSGCATSETLHDNHCDCAVQLDDAMKMIAREGRGAIVHFPEHDGRGAGLFNKVESYLLMDRKGLTTADAFRELGLPVESRDFRTAGHILRDVGVKSVRLISNNPFKQQALEAAGIRVERLVPLVRDDAPEHIKAYLRSKADQMGHVIEPSEAETVAARHVQDSAIAVERGPRRDLRRGSRTPHDRESTSRDQSAGGRPVAQIEARKAVQRKLRKARVAHGL